MHLKWTTASFCFAVGFSIAASMQIVVARWRPIQIGDEVCTFR